MLLTEERFDCLLEAIVRDVLETIVEADNSIYITINGKPMTRREYNAYRAEKNGKKEKKPNPDRENAKAALEMFKEDVKACMVKAKPLLQLYNFLIHPERYSSNNHELISSIPGANVGTCKSKLTAMMKTYNTILTARGLYGAKSYIEQLSYDVDDAMKEAVKLARVLTAPDTKLQLGRLPIMTGRFARNGAQTVAGLLSILNAMLTYNKDIHAAIRKLREMAGLPCTNVEEINVSPAKQMANQEAGRVARVTGNTPQAEKVATTQPEKQLSPEEAFWASVRADVAAYEAGKNIEK